MSTRRGSSAPRVLALVALWTIPVVAVVVAVPLTASLDAESVAAEQPDTVTVGSREVDRAIAVNATVTLGAQPELKSGADGVVTGLTASGTIEQGAELFAVNGVPVLAYSGEVLHRDLARGDRGADVEALGEYLVQLGLLDSAPAGDQLDRSIEAAVKKLQERLGVSTDGVFRLSYIAYVPEGAKEITSPVVELGDAISAGSTVLQATAPVDSVVLTPVSTGNLAAYSGLDLALRLGDLAVDVSGVENTGDEATRIAAALDEATRAGTVRVETTEPSAYSGGVLVLRDPLTSGVVPSTSVLIDSDATTCVIVVEGHNDESPQHTALVLEDATEGTEVGTVVVDPSAIGANVVRDVSRLPEAQRTCD